MLNYIAARSISDLAQDIFYFATRSLLCLLIAS